MTSRAGVLLAASLAGSSLLGWTVAGHTHPHKGHSRPPRSVPGLPASPLPTPDQLCRPGYTASVRPPAGYTTDLKRRQMRDWHLPGRTSDYEEDHLIPLEIGGAPRDERNLWPQPWPEAREKDREENQLHDQVCTHRLTVRAAQAQMLRDWGPR